MRKRDSSGTAALRWRGARNGAAAATTRAEAAQTAQMAEKGNFPSIDAFCVDRLKTGVRDFRAQRSGEGWW